MSENNRKAKFYRLGATGKKELESGTRTWSRYAEAVFKVLRAPVEEGVS
jgi:PadR family transcriptional regulator PadR